MDHLIERLLLGEAIDHDAIISRNIKSYSLVNNRILHNNILFATIVNGRIKKSYSAILDDATFAHKKFDKVVIVGSDYFKLNKI